MTQEELLTIDIFTVIEYHRKRYDSDPPQTFLLCNLRRGMHCDMNIPLKRRWRIGGSVVEAAKDLGFHIYHEGRVTRIGLAEDHPEKPQWPEETQSDVDYENSLHEGEDR